MKILNKLHLIPKWVFIIDSRRSLVRPPNKWHKFVIKLSTTIEVEVYWIGVRQTGHVLFIFNHFFMHVSQNVWLQFAEVACKIIKNNILFIY